MGDSFGTRFRFLGDTSSGSCLTVGVRHLAGMVVGWDRFRLAGTEPAESTAVVEPEPAEAPRLPAATRRVSSNGLVSFASARYNAGKWLAGETVEVVCDGGFVHLHHRGVLVATRGPPPSGRR